MHCKIKKISKTQQMNLLKLYDIFMQHNLGGLQPIIVFLCFDYQTI